MEKYALRLALQDQYHFIGGGCGIADQEYYMPNGEETVLRRLVISTLHELEYTYYTTTTDDENDDDDEDDDENSNSGEKNSSNNSTKKSTSSTSIMHYSRQNPEFEKGYHLVTKMLQRMSYLRQRQRSVIVSGEQFGSILSRRKAVMTTFQAMLTDGTTNGTTGTGTTTVGGNNNKNDNTNNNVNTNIIDETTGKVVTAGFPLPKIRIVLAYRYVTIVCVCDETTCVPFPTVFSHTISHSLFYFQFFFVTFSSYISFSHTHTFTCTHSLVLTFIFIFMCTFIFYVHNIKNRTY